MVDKMDRSTMAANYGFALSFMKSDPELYRLFNKAVGGTWAPDKFVAHLRDTKWFQTHSASVRNAILQQTSDPATYEANVDQMFATVRDTWGNLYGQGNMDPKQLRGWAETAHRMGWSEAQLVDRLTKSVNYRKIIRQKTLGGQAAALEGQLDSLQQNYGVKLGNKWKASQMKRVMAGNDTTEGVQRRVQELAMREYGAFADRIASGESVMDIAAPYMSKMADMLELAEGDISIHDKNIQNALKQKTDKGKAAALDLNDFERLIRRDKRWALTENAREEVNGITTNLLRSFGVMA